MTNFLLQVKTIVDSLALVGEPISLQEHIDVILKVFLEDQGSIISVIKSKFATLPMEEVEALLAHEMCLQKFCKKLLTKPTMLIAHIHLILRIIS